MLTIGNISCNILTEGVIFDLSVQPQYRLINVINQTLLAMVMFCCLSNIINFLKMYSGM